MRNWKNSVEVNGYVYSHTLQVKKTGEHSRVPGTEFITGTVNVAIDDEMLTVIPVNFGYVTEFFNKKNSDGTQKKNDTFALLKRLIDNNEVVENIAYGAAGAMHIRIQGDIECNDFISRKTGELVSTQRIRGGFAHTGYTSDEKMARFKTDMLITNYAEKESEDGEPLYGTLSGYVFNYRNEFMPVKFTVRVESGMKYFEDQDVAAEPMLTNVWGDIVNTTVERKIEVETAFGAPSVSSTTKSFRSWDVVGASYEPYDFGEEEVMTMEDVKAGLKAREEKLANLKKNQKDSIENVFAEKPKKTMVVETNSDDYDF